jgi:hypothetical protein
MAGHVPLCHLVEGGWLVLRGFGGRQETEVVPCPLPHNLLNEPPTCAIGG